MNKHSLRRIEPGRYEGFIFGVFVSVRRYLKGQEHGRQPEWKVTSPSLPSTYGPPLLADGHATMGGSVDAAERSIRFRNLQDAPFARANREAQGRDRDADEHRQNRASGARIAAARRKTIGKRIL